MTVAQALYDTDFVLWTERQAEALRAAAREGSNLPVDWDRVAEEIEDLGSEIRRRIESHVELILTHLLKIACSPAERNVPKWKSEIDGWRGQIERLLRENHALRARFVDIVAEEWPNALKGARRSFIRFDEPGAIERLKAWREKPMTAADVLTEGRFPVPGTLDMAQEPE